MYIFYVVVEELVNIAQQHFVINENNFGVQQINDMSVLYVEPRTSKDDRRKSVLRISLVISIQAAALLLEERHWRVRLDDVRVLLIEVRCRRDGLLVLAVARAAFVDVGDVELSRAAECLLETFFL